MNELKAVNKVGDVIIGKWYHVQHIGFENLTRVLQAYNSEGVKALDANGRTIWLDVSHEKEVLSKFIIKELPEFDNLKLTRRDKAIERLRTNEALEEDIIEKDKRIEELEDALRGAAADLSQAGLQFHDLLLIAKGKK